MTNVGRPRKTMDSRNVVGGVGGVGSDFEASCSRTSAQYRQDNKKAVSPKRKQHQVYILITAIERAIRRMIPLRRETERAHVQSRSSLPRKKGEEKKHPNHPRPETESNAKYFKTRSSRHGKEDQAITYLKIIRTNYPSNQPVDQGSNHPSLHRTNY